MQPANARLRRRFAAVLVLLAVVLAAGCARVDTVLTINGDGEGKRNITLTVSKEDFSEYVEGGVKAVEKSIKNHLPDGLTYQGASEKGEDRIFKFELKFSSLEDYSDTVAQIITLGSGEPFVPEIKMEAPGSIFRTGVQLQENFTSEDLMVWLQDALNEDGVIDRDGSSDIFEAGSTVVKFEGESIEANYRISVNTIADHGVSRVAMQTTIAEDGFERSIEYRLNVKSYQSASKDFDAYFADATPKGGELEKGNGNDGTVMWTMTFSAPDTATLVEHTNQALGSSNAGFEVSDQVVTEEGVSLQRTIVDFADCSAICSPRASAVTDVVVMDAGWEGGNTVDPQELGLGEDRIAIQVETDGKEVTVRQPLKFTQATVTTSLGYDLSIDQTITVDVATEAVAKASEAFNQLLTPAEDFGSLERTEADGVTTFVISVHADSPEGYNTAMAGFLPGNEIVAPPDAGSGVRAEYVAVTTASLASIGYHEPIEMTVTVPWAQSISYGPEPEREISFTLEDAAEGVALPVSGWTRTGLIVAAVAIVIVLALVVTAVIVGLRLSRKSNRSAVQQEPGAGQPDQQFPDQQFQPVQPVQPDQPVQPVQPGPDSGQQFGEQPPHQG